MTKAHAHTFSPDTVTKRSKATSLIAKCTAPFTAKQRSHLEQEIRLDEPFRQYTPGDTIKGAIHLNVGKPLRITHLVVRLHGFVKVFNRARLPGEELSYDESRLTSANGGRRGMEYFGNGYARIFEDEAVLCGEGRVVGEYQFRFEMVLPSKNMPSSIDFEHGTITYLITSTVTRPIAIAPTSVQHFKLHVQEAIDVARLPRPKPVVLSVVSSHKKARPKSGEHSAGMPSTSGRTSKSSSCASSNVMPISRTVGQGTDEEPPSQSPIQSELASITARSSSASSSGTYHGEPQLCAVQNSTEDILIMSNPNTISAKTELLQAGCLAGDALPLKITVKHDKPVKSMQGIIITLYRQGRIDTHPAIPLGTFRKGEKRRYEDYYPRSRTGLGGLSLSSAGSSRSFRQDLNQIFVPIIVDPRSLTAIINTSIQAPADLFPSITNVPGAMVSFKYFVEVVIDLRGKLSGQDRILPHLSMTRAPQHGYGDPKISKHEDVDGVNYLSTPGFNYLITDQLRRTRGVISTRTEITIGTRDSARRRGKYPCDRFRVAEHKFCRSLVDLGHEEQPEISRNASGYSENVLGTQGEEQHAVDLISPSQTASIALPAPETEPDEKARLKRAEQRLLPHAPRLDENTTSSSTALMPSAPSAVDEEDFAYRYSLGAPAPAYEGPSRNHAEMTGQNVRNTNAIGSFHMSRNSAGSQDDKQELERQRLLALASAPDYSSADGADVEGNTPRTIVPSAPILYEDDIFSIHDPRIPQSSPADFADDRIVLQGEVYSSAPLAPTTDGRPYQANLDQSNIRPFPTEASEENVLRASDEVNHRVESSDNYSIHTSDHSNESHARDDMGVHDENTSVYDR